MNIIELIPQSLILLIAANYSLGILLKQIKFNARFLPLAILTFSIIFSCLLIGMTAESIIQGILCWGVSAGIYDIGKQLNK